MMMEERGEGEEEEEAPPLIPDSLLLLTLIKGIQGFINFLTSGHESPITKAATKFNLQKAFFIILILKQSQYHSSV